MRGKSLVAAMAVTGWIALAIVGIARAASAADGAIDSGVYYSEFNGAGPNAGDILFVDWYQGQEGQWHRGPSGEWNWHGNRGNEWYWGQRGHWYKERNGWQFGSDGLVCNNNGRDCRRGRYLPPNGEGMVNKKHPNLYWHCDSNGNHCDWARRPG
jgi:hypothetical protein